MVVFVPGVVAFGVIGTVAVATGTIIGAVMFVSGSTSRPRDAVGVPTAANDMKSIFWYPPKTRRITCGPPVRRNRLVTLVYES